MKITFEDGGAQIVVDLPNQQVREALKGARDIPCVMGLEAEVEILGSLVEDISTVLNCRLPIPGNPGPMLLRMVLLFLDKVDPGAPVDFWDLWVKFKRDMAK